MRAIPFWVSVLLVSGIPLAAADCVGDLCVSETSEGPCTEMGDQRWSATTVSTPIATAEGSSRCANDPENGEIRVSAISVSAASAGVAWSGSTTGCAMWVQSGEDFTLLPCALGPPDPGWGSLLS